MCGEKKHVKKKEEEEEETAGEKEKASTSLDTSGRINEEEMKRNLETKTESERRREKTKAAVTSLWRVG